MKSTLVRTPTSDRFKLSVPEAFADLTGSISSLDEMALHVSDFGAKGDGDTDDWAAIQRTIDRAAVEFKPVVFVPGKIYNVSREVLSSTTCRIVGPGKFTGGVRATAPMRSVFSAVGGVLHLSDCQIYGGRQSKGGVYIETASASVIERVHIYQPTLDGIQITNSDSCRILDVAAELCGTLFATSHYAGNSPLNIRQTVTGSVTVVNITVGPSTFARITGSGTHFLAANARAGDFVALHATAAGDNTSVFIPIASVNSDTEIYCVGPVVAPFAAGSDYALLIGDGYHEGPSRADNNNHHINGWISRNIAGCGLHHAGLYGPKVVSAQCDASGAYPICVDSQSQVCIGSSFDKCYFELNNAADNFAFGYAVNINIGVTNSQGEPVLLFGPSFAIGNNLSMQNASDIGRVDPIGSSPISYIPSAVIATAARVKGSLKFGWNDTVVAPGPGDATVTTAYSGHSAIKAGASTAVFTHTDCSVDDAVIITPCDLDATLTRFKVVSSNGFFTVTGDANATADWKFNWHLFKRSN